MREDPYSYFDVCAGAFVFLVSSSSYEAYLARAGLKSQSAPAVGCTAAGG